MNSFPPFVNSCITFCNTKADFSLYLLYWCLQIYFSKTCDSRSARSFWTLHQFGVFALEPEPWFWSKFQSIKNPPEIQRFAHSACILQSLLCGAGKASGWTGCGGSLQLLHLPTCQELLSLICKTSVLQGCVWGKTHFCCTFSFRPSSTCPRGWKP